MKYWHHNNVYSSGLRIAKVFHFLACVFLKLKCVQLSPLRGHGHVLDHFFDFFIRGSVDQHHPLRSPLAIGASALGPGSVPLLTDKGVCKAQGSNPPIDHARP